MKKRIYPNSDLISARRSLGVVSLWLPMILHSFSCDAASTCVFLRKWFLRLTFFPTFLSMSDPPRKRPLVSLADLVKRSRLDILPAAAGSPSTLSTCSGQSSEIPSSLLAEPSSYLVPPVASFDPLSGHGYVTAMGATEVLSEATLSADSGPEDQRGDPPPSDGDPSVAGNTEDTVTVHHLLGSIPDTSALPEDCLNQEIIRLWTFWSRK